ncbi:protein of unknown function [Pseudomonas inefficax]|uniref:Uncharacterized protein n=1 Tax=Pseudomonas inefficax TaxID=2078786 RepID=A0AAQ1PD91_9PSED|nr:protein of unknown function [Pseudomonas inefficax]
MATAIFAGEPAPTESPQASKGPTIHICIPSPRQRCRIGLFIASHPRRVYELWPSTRRSRAVFGPIRASGNRPAAQRT